MLLKETVDLRFKLMNIEGLENTKKLRIFSGGQNFKILGSKFNTTRDGMAENLRVYRTTEG